MSDINPFSRCFFDEALDVQRLKERAYNFRWAEQEDGVIPLTAADPDFSLAPPIREALCDYLAQGSLAYGPAQGLPSFREAVAQDLRDGGVDAHPDQVLATDGAASAMFLIARALLSPGDEVIIFDPVDFLFERSAVSVGAVPLRVPFTRSGGIDLDLLAELTQRPRVKLIALCAPHNPYGRLLRAEEVTRVAELAHQHNLHILSDEVWAKITYERAQAHTAAHPLAASRTFTVSGFSKCYGLAGLRIGYLHAPSREAFERVMSASHVGDTAFGATTLSQVAAVAGLTQGALWFEAFKAHLTEARALICARLDALEGLRCDQPEATYLASPQLIRGAWRPHITSEQLSAALLTHARVAVVPGSPRFFGPRAEGLIRLSFATSLGLIDESMRRIEGAWPQLRALYGA